MNGMMLPGTSAGIPGRLAVCGTCNQGAVVSDVSRGVCGNGHRDLCSVRYGQTVTFGCRWCGQPVTVDSYNPADLAQRGRADCGCCGGAAR